MHVSNKRLIISIAATTVIGIAVLLSFVTGGVGMFTGSDSKFTTSMVLSSLMTVSSCIFCIVGFYLSYHNRIDDDKLRKDGVMLYMSGDLYCYSFWFGIVVGASIILLGIIEFGVKLADSYWGCWRIVPLLFMHVNAGFNISWAWFPFGYIKPASGSYQWVAAESTEEKTPK